MKHAMLGLFWHAISQLRRCFRACFELVDITAKIMHGSSRILLKLPEHYYVLNPFQIIRRFDFSKFMTFAMYLDIHYV
jgi:hypothetical protein